MQTCEKHDDCVVVYADRLRECPHCKAEEERDEAKDMLKEAESEISDLKQSLEKQEG